MSSRLLALLTSLFVLTTTLLTPAAAADPDSPAARAAEWIAAELASPEPDFDQFGAAAARTDVILALAVAGTQHDAARRALADLAATASDYVGPPDSPNPGAVAKVLVAVQVSREDPAAFLAGRDLEAELRDMQRPDGSFAPDVFSHALAMLALVSTEAGVPADAAAWLLDRQRDDGAWASDFAPDAPDLDVTALALQAAVAADTTAAVEAAADFLTAEQNTDGSWPSPFGDPNANTAGVAALALRAAGRDAAADAAAGFVTALQTDDGGIRFTAAEPAANGYATLQGILAFAAVPLPELEIDPFADVAWGDLFDGEIDWLADTDITRGCTPDHFCPDDPVTRGQMAAFLHRALGTTLPTGEATDFTDTTTSVFADDIEWLSATGITRGCTPDHFCPDDPVTRGQMAAFLHRALGG
jgi:hypothetical protein